MHNKPHANIDSYGYINARVRAMKSVLLNRDFYEELIHTKEFMSLISLLEKSPYRTEVEECTISRTEMAEVDEALKRNLSRNFRRILNFTAGEPHDLIMMLLGRWDLHNIITLLRGIHIKATPDQIMESLIPAGELEMPFLEQLSQQSSIKEIINLIATWGSPYAKALNEKFKEYVENENLPVLELSLYKMYYQYVRDLIRNRTYNSKIFEELITYEIDAINTTTILRLQQMKIEDLIQRKKEEEISNKIKTKAKQVNKEDTLWEKLIQERKTGGIIFTKTVKTNILKRIITNGFYLLINKISSYTSGKKHNITGITNKIFKRKKINDKKSELIESFSREEVENNINEYFIEGGKEINKEDFTEMCLTMNVEKVLRKLKSTSFGVILDSVLQRYLERDSISILERKIEEMVIKRGASVYNKNPLSIGIPIGYIWKKYNEVVNIRIILRCKRVGMPETKIRDELILI